MAGRDVLRVGVVGLGTMGAGIAEVFAAAGLHVTGVESDADLLAGGRQRLVDSVERGVRRGRRTEAERDELLARTAWTTDVADLADRDLVVEAVSERMAVKHDVFAGLDAVVPEHAILATNTSSLSVTEIASGVGRAGRVVGMHFFNPAPVQRLVEVVHTVTTDRDAVETVTELARRLGKHPVVIGDRAGFIANALLFGYLNRAVTMVQDGQVSAADVDTAMRVGCGYPLGPLALLDLIGLDVAYEILLAMHRESGDPAHVPARLLRQLVTAGRLGRKSGRGFHAYGDEATATAGPDDGAEPARAVPRTVALAGESAALTTLLADAGVAPVAFGTAGAAELTLVEADGPDWFTPASAGVALRFPAGTAETGLVEVLRAPGTDPARLAAAVATCTAAGRTPVVVADRAGGVVDALLLPYVNDAVRTVASGYASADDVDAAMKLGCALPEGPVEVLERRGADAVVDGLRAMHAETGATDLVPVPLLLAAARGATLR